VTDIPPSPLRALDEEAAPAWPGVTPASGATGRRLTEILSDLGFVSPARLEAAAETGRATGQPPERVLLEQRAIDAEQLARAIAERYGLDHLDLAAFPVDGAAVNLIAATVAARQRAVPVAFVDEQTLLVAIADPANTAVLADISTRTRLEVRAAVASAEAIAAVIDGEPAPAPVVELSETAPSFELARALLAEAAGRRATALHLEPDGDELRVRARVDGALVPLRRVPVGVIPALKTMPELRLSTLATRGGESAVVRLDGPPPRSLDELGLRSPQLEAALRRGRGAVLVAGPSARRREQALHAILAAATTPERRVVVAHRDLDQAVEADPDVLLVEAIRDRETATAALDAALDGVLVLAGVPAPDAERARARLAALGVEPFLLEHAVVCLLGPRPTAPGPG
jgi:type IV pilus assembly protein PilB